MTSLSLHSNPIPWLSPLFTQETGTQEKAVASTEPQRLGGHPWTQPRQEVTLLKSLHVDPPNSSFSLHLFSPVCPLRVPYPTWATILICVILLFVGVL